MHIIEVSNGFTDLDNLISYGIYPDRRLFICDLRQATDFYEGKGKTPPYLEGVDAENIINELRRLAQITKMETAQRLKDVAMKIQYQQGVRFDAKPCEGMEQEGSQEITAQG